MRADVYKAIKQGPNVWNEYRETRRASDRSWVADLYLANLRGADLTGASLSGAKLAHANLAHAHLDVANLAHANLGEADLTGAGLAHANLRGADLTGASLSGAKLCGAGLSGAKLTVADLADANLSGADLANANLFRANLRSADLSGASLGYTLLSDLDVSALCGVQDLRHGAPSIIDVRTMIRSYTHPRIVPFMVDCGIPETFALYMVDCARAESQGDLVKMMHSTFISYGGPDQDFAEKIYRALKPSVQVWSFPKSAKWGQRVETEAYRGIQQHDRILLLCSRDSLNRTGVIQEIRETLAREARDDAIYLLPVRLDDYLFDTGGWVTRQPELCQRLRDRVIGDFRDARADQATFDQAIHELKQQLMKDRPGQ